MTKHKRIVEHIASCAIIYREKNPAELLVEKKDSTYPIASFRNHLSLIGGHWLGKEAIGDNSPLDTLKRELKEEFSLHSGAHSTKEMKILGSVRKARMYLVPKKRKNPPPEHEKNLKSLLHFFMKKNIPLGDYLHSLSKKQFGFPRGNSSVPYFTTIDSYHIIPVPEKHWQNLLFLQKIYGNISNESFTRVVSLQNILTKKMKFIPVHERALYDFFRHMRVKQWKKFPRGDTIKNKLLGPVRNSYGKYLADFEVIAKPSNY